MSIFLSNGKLLIHSALHLNAVSNWQMILLLMKEFLYNFKILKCIDIDIKKQTPK